MAVDPGRAVLYSTLVTMTSTVGASVLPEDHGGHGQLPSFKLLFGSALTFAGLSIMADITPGIAVPLSVAIAVTALTYYGVPILDSYFTDPKGKTP